jgi:hypothetical protein
MKRVKIFMRHVLAEAHGNFKLQEALQLGKAGSEHVTNQMSYFAYLPVIPSA